MGSITESINKHKGINVNYFFALLKKKSFKNPQEVDQFFNDPEAWFIKHQESKPFFRLLQKLEKTSDLNEDERDTVEENVALQAAEKAFRSKDPCSLWNLFNRVLCVRCRQKAKTSPPPSPTREVPSEPVPRTLSMPARPASPKAPSMPSAKSLPLEVSAPSQPPAAPLSIHPPELPWIQNNCFITAAIWAYLVGDPVNLKQLETARGTIPDLLRAILANPDRETQKVLLTCLREELHSLSPNTIPSSTADDTMGDTRPICEVLNEILYKGAGTNYQKTSFKANLQNEIVKQTCQEHLDTGSSLVLEGENLARFDLYLQNLFNHYLEGKLKDGLVFNNQIRFVEAPLRLQFCFQNSPKRMDAPSRIDLRPFMTTEGPPVHYQLRSAILKRGAHFISLLCQEQPDGKMRYLLCDNIGHPQIREISKEQAAREMREGSCDFIYTLA